MNDSIESRRDAADARRPERLRESVDLCLRWMALGQLIDSAQDALNVTFPSDEAYLSEKKDPLWLYFATFVGALQIFGLLLTLLVRVVLHGSAHFPAAVGVVWSLAAVMSFLGTVHTYREHRDALLKSEEYARLRRDREWYAGNAEALRQCLADRKAELGALERRMNEERQCLIPSRYWSVPEILRQLIDSRQAKDVDEAIGLYETLSRQEKREGGDALSAMRRAQAALVESAREQTVARIREDRTAPYAGNSEMWERLRGKKE